LCLELDGAAGESANPIRGLGGLCILDHVELHLGAQGRPHTCEQQDEQGEQQEQEEQEQQEEHTRHHLACVEVQRRRRRNALDRTRLEERQKGEQERWE